MTHPKIVGLSDKAFRTWVWGLSYAQQHLTDGRIPDAALPARLKRASLDLIGAGLWGRLDVGFQIHDYLDWNDSRQAITGKRSAAAAERAASRDRLKRWRERRNNGVSSTVSETESERTTHSTPRHSTPRKTKRVYAHRAHAYCGRFCVPQFLHDEFTGMVGTAFDLLGWYPAQEPAALEAGIVADPLRWWRVRLKAALPATPSNALPAFIPWRCDHEPTCESRWRCERKQQAEVV